MPFKTIAENFLRLNTLNCRMIIRPAKTTDASALSRLISQLGYASADPSSVEKIDAYSKEGYKMLIAELNDKVIGFISLHWYVTPHLPGPTGRITAFCMDENLRGKGLGTNLLKELKRTGTTSISAIKRHQDTLLNF